MVKLLRPSCYSLGLEEGLPHCRITHFGLLVFLKLHLYVALVVSLQLIHVLNVLCLELIKEVVLAVVQIDQCKYSPEYSDHNTVERYPVLGVLRDRVVHC